MNKLIISSNHTHIKSGSYSIKYDVNNVKLTISGDVIIKDFHNKDISLDIELLDKASLHYIKSNKNSKNDVINVTLHNNSRIDFNYSLRTKFKSNVTFNSNVYGNNNVSNFIFCGVTEDLGNIKISATSDVKGETLDNNVLENIRILMLNDMESVVIPNLLVSTDKVLAIHNTAISGVPKDYLYYLNSKGIDKTQATKLIVDGFLKNNIKL